MHTPELTKTPFKEIRLVIPIRLTTDPWSVDSMTSAVVDDWSSPPTPPDLAYAY